MVNGMVQSGMMPGAAAAGLYVLFGLLLIGTIIYIQVRRKPSAH
jgi:hypothetical protein